MKKLLAILLAVAMLCTLSVSVFAETARPVGTHGVSSSINDGWTETQFSANGETAVNVDIKATIGDVQHRYAVDIEYEVMNFSVTGTNLVWNVNTLQYVSDGAPSDPAKTDFNVLVINYSDLPVDLTVALTDTNGDTDFAKVTSSFTGTDTLEDAVGVELANVKTADTAKSFVVSIDPITDKTWVDVTNYYANYFGDNPGETEVTMATLTITIAKVPTP